jgi:hypothetical protein
MNVTLQKSGNTAALALACLLLMVLCLSPVSAIDVAGAKYMGSIAPGGTDIHTITIGIGADQKPMDAQIDVQGFGQSLKQIYIPLAPANDLGPCSARTFISLSNTTVHLVPGVPQTVKATITLPKNVGNGGRYAIITVHSVANNGEFVTTGVNIPVFITVSGTKPTESGSILTVDAGEVTIGQPISITTTFKNTGNYHYYFTQNAVAIKDTNGNLIGNYTTQPSIFALIPGNTVQYIATPTIQNLAAGTYTADSKVLLQDGTVLDEKTATFEVKTNYIPPVTESNITLTPGSAGTLTSPDGRYSISFPQGAVLGDAVVTLKPYSHDRLQPAPTDSKLGATCFEITGLPGLLSKDATVKVHYSADDLAVAGGDASQLKLSYYDAAKDTWVILPTQLDSGSTTLTATTNHLSVWAVMVSTSSTSGALPGAAATKSPLPFTVVVASLIIAGIAGIRRGRT